MGWSVYITRQIPQTAIDRLLKSGLQVEVFTEDRAVPDEVLRSKVEQCDALLCLLTDKITEEIITAGKNLKIISNYAVGFNNVDVAAATQSGIPVTNTPGILTEATADLTFLLILGTARRIIEADRFVRSGKFTGWGPLLLLGSELNQKKLGIIGAGRIGSAVAKRASAFNMHIVYTDRHANQKIEEQYGAKRVQLNHLIQHSDFISIHVDLNDSTFHLMNRERLHKMKPDAFLINTSRGPVVDEQALVSVLKYGKIGGAGLDVFEFEPDLTPGLKDLDNVILLPHIASATTETRTKMAETAVENIISLYKGKTPPNIINPEVLKN